MLPIKPACARDLRKSGQTCSSKAISQYPQDGYVCLTSNGRLTLRRK